MTQAVEIVECLEAVSDEPGTCEGAVMHREPLSGTGRRFPRCDRHWTQRLEFDAELNRRYPAHPPSDWSPLDAGEAWDEEDY